MAIVVQPKWRSSQNGIALVNSYLVFRRWYSCLSHVELNSMGWHLLLFQFMDLVPLDEITHRLPKSEWAKRKTPSALDHLFNVHVPIFKALL